METVPAESSTPFGGTGLYRNRESRVPVTMQGPVPKSGPRIRALLQQGFLSGEFSGFRPFEQGKQFVDRLPTAFGEAEENISSLNLVISLAVRWVMSNLLRAPRNSLRSSMTAA